MFWGIHLKNGVQASYKAKNNQQNVKLHITNAALLNNSVDKVQVLVNIQGKQSVLAVLDKSNKQFISKLNYYFLPEENAQFSLKGIGEVDLCGYFEPIISLDIIKEELKKQLYKELKLSEDDSEESDDNEKQEKSKPIKNLFGQNQNNKNKEKDIDNNNDEFIQQHKPIIDDPKPKNSQSDNQYQKGSVSNLLQKRKADPNFTIDDLNKPQKVQVNNSGIPNVREQLKQKYQQDKKDKRKNSNQ